MAARGSGVSKTEWDKVCDAANKAISLLQLDSKTSDVAATLTSHATGKRGQHVVEIIAMDLDGNCKNCGREASVEDDESTDEDLREATTQTTTAVETTPCRDTVNSPVAP